MSHLQSAKDAKQKLEESFELAETPEEMQALRFLITRYDQQIWKLSKLPNKLEPPEDPQDPEPPEEPEGNDPEVPEVIEDLLNP